MVGNKPMNVIVPELLAAILKEQQKTNVMITKFVNESEVEGPVEKLGKLFDGRKKRK
jgi:hypothetical protein